MLWLPFLAVGTLGFWVVLAISSIIVSSLIDDDNPLGATLVALVTIVGLCFLGNLNPLALLREHTFPALMIVPAYLGMGVFWGVAKWYFYVHKMRRKLVEHKGKFEIERKEKIQALNAQQERLDSDVLKVEQSNYRVDANFRRELDHRAQDIANARKSLSDENKTSQWENYVVSHGFRTKIPLLVSEHKVKIVSWMSLWPASLLWTLMNDPVQRLYEIMYDWIGNSLQSISNRAFRDFDGV